MTALVALILLFFGGLWHYEEQSKRQEQFAEIFKRRSRPKRTGRSNPPAFSSPKLAIC